jgi:PST family polysaccharide transporter
VLILGLLTTHEITGYYSVAEKIIRSIQSVQNVIGDALYPHLVKKFDKNKNGFYSLNEKYKYIIIVAYILMTVVVLGMSGIMTKVLTGRHPGNVKLDLEIMSFVVLFGGLNYYYGILGLVALNYKKEFSTYVLITGIISILLTVVLSKFFNDIGAAFAAVLSEAILFILIIIKLKKLELKYGR